MSKKLACLVGKSEEEVARFIAQMEARFGYPSADVRLLAEITQSARQKMADLGLDPQDTTSEELYHALRAKFDQNSAQIDRALGIKPDTGLDRRIAKASQLVRHILGEVELWALKTSAAKALLRACPPRKTMMRLNFRSLESMLKHADIDEILLVVPYMESTVWQRSFARWLSRSSTTDYGLRPVELVLLKSKKYQAEPSPSDYVAISKAGAAVGLWPAKKLNCASGLYLALLLLNGLEQLGVEVELQKLANAHPALNWWASTNHLIALNNNRPVSFNLRDASLNHLNNLDFVSASARYGSQSLWAELIRRYYSHDGELLPSLGVKIETKGTGKITVPTAAQLAEELAGV